MGANGVSPEILRRRSGSLIAEQTQSDHLPMLRPHWNGWLVDFDTVQELGKLAERLYRLEALV
jgi:hypothetical protein